jgi:CHAT domain-containing protein
VLAVGAPQHTGQDRLRYGDREASLVRAAFQAGRYMRPAEATRQEVLAALGRFDVLHFACHGRTDLFDPLAGGLLLDGDDVLTLRDVLGLRLPGTRLAVLSACESAVTGVTLPDEVVSLPTGLLQAGCAGVIGSLWQVPDESTLLIMSEFFRQWRQRRTEPAEALRCAQQHVRDVTNRDLAASGAPGRASPPADPRLVPAWARRQPYAHPQAWAAFTYIGA